jgi:hypothetical protein
VSSPRFPLGRSAELSLRNELSLLAVALRFVASDHATGPATEQILASDPAQQQQMMAGKAEYSQTSARNRGGE